MPEMGIYAVNGSLNGSTIFVITTNYRIPTEIVLKFIKLFAGDRVRVKFISTVQSPSDR